jgi:hypothetical protein
LRPTAQRADAAAIRKFVDSRCLDHTVSRPPGRFRMIHRLYLLALLALQLALIVKLAPPLAQALRTDALPGLAPEGLPAMLQFLATGLAVAGAALALAFPGVALLRHRRAGSHRFLGLPGWAVALALAGTLVLGAAALLLTLAPMLPDDMGMTAVLIARSGIAGGLAMAAAGVLCAELLRRSVAAGRSALPDRHSERGRIEVTHPPELRTLTPTHATGGMPRRLG